MRDPKRIRKFCNQLADIWESQCPDWRFGQLVENVYRASGISIPFYVEDEEMLELSNGVLIYKKRSNTNPGKPGCQKIDKSGVKSLVTA